jgi:hypothetical protein
VEEDDGEEVDESGVEPKDIELVMTQVSHGGMTLDQGTHSAVRPSFRIGDEHK